MNNAYVLATCLYHCWCLGDQALRDELKHAIKAYVKRHPHFLDYLHKVVASFTAPYNTRDGSSYELAASLSSSWYFSDGDLRSDLEAMIRRLAKRKPAIGRAFKQGDQSAETGAIHVAAISRIAP